MQPVLSLSKGAPAILFAALLGVLASPSNDAHAIAPGQQAAMASFVRPIPKNSFYFTGNSYGQTLQAAWIASITAGTGTTGVGMVYPSPNQTAAPSITALGITSETGISPDGDGSCGGGTCQGANYVTYMEGLMYTLRQAGITKVWTNEGGAWSDSGTPTAVQDYNAIFQYWHTICPGCWIGMSMNGLSTNAYRDVPLFIQHGLIGLDFADDEEYGTLYCSPQCFGAARSSYIDDTAAGAAYGFNQGYPSVQIGRLVYNHESLCGISPAIMAQLDFIQYWALDNNAVFAAHDYMDADWYATAQSVAANSDLYTPCRKTRSYLSSGGTGGTTTSNFTIGVFDNVPSGWGGTSSVQNCQYKVMAGNNLENGGPNAPGATTTLDWTSRTCGGSITITVGAGQNCNVTGGAPLSNYTCIVLYRAQDANGVQGQAEYSTWAVNF